MVKLEHDAADAYKGAGIGSRSRRDGNLLGTMDENNEQAWKRFVGLD